MRRTTVLAVTVVVQLALVGVATIDQLSGRLFGEEYLFRVAAVDPVDPFRGAYADLDYPDLREKGSSVPASWEDDDAGPMYVTLEPAGEFWSMGQYTRSRPEDGPYLACDDREWRVRCGIESWFASEGEARRMERTLARGGAVATVRIDSRGHAALVSVDAR